jgi:hypothetical protein
MRTRILLCLLVLAPAVHAQERPRDSAFVAFTAEPFGASRLTASSIAKQKFEVVVATRTSQFPDIARGSSRLAECTIPRAVQPSPSRDR